MEGKSIAECLLFSPEPLGINWFKGVPEMPWMEKQNPVHRQLRPPTQESISNVSRAKRSPRCSAQAPSVFPDGHGNSASKLKQTENLLPG